MSNALAQFQEFMVKPSALNKPNFIALYGVPGSGKTWLAASISEVKEYAPVLIIDTENSTQGTTGDFDDANIDIIPVSSHEGFMAVMDALEESADSEDFKYKTVIIDTLDVAQSRAVDYFIAEEEAKDKPNTMAAWGSVKRWTEHIGRFFQESDFLGIVVAHSNREKLDSGVLMDSFDLMGSAKNSFPGIPDIVGFTEREDGVTTVHVASSKRRSTKNRFGLPDAMEDPTMSDILELIAGKKIAEPAPKKKTATKKKEDK